MTFPQETPAQTACSCLIEEDTPESNGAWDMRGCPVHDECTCYLGHPNDPSADPEACGVCDREFWANPVFMMEDD